jgi:dTDP-3,4-didehydro-2,6-dideoxy-alpha-D-glucose 3-reductase
MKILIIGYSSIVRRRVLPSLLSIKKIREISIASQTINSIDFVPEQLRGELYSDYDEALSNFDGNLTYISLPNALHYFWAKKALHNKLHVIIDKPSVIKLSQSKELTLLAKQKSLCIAEANVWNYHPLAKKILSYFNNYGKPLNINMIFTSPKLDKNNFRYNTKLGSGIILDRASYVISCGKFFYNQKPIKIHCSVNKVDKLNNVDISAAISLIYSSGFQLNSFISLSSEYKNEITCFGENYILKADRIFTPPSDYKGVIKLTRNNKKSKINVPSNDSFKLFINDAIQSINKNNFGKFGKDMLESSEIMDKIINKT